VGNSRSVRDGYCSGTVSWNDVGLDAELNCLGVADYTYTGQGRSRSGLKPRRALAPRRTRLEGKPHQRQNAGCSKQDNIKARSKIPQRTSVHVERQVASVDSARCSKESWRTETPRLSAGRQHDTESFACSLRRRQRIRFWRNCSRRLAAIVDLSPDRNTSTGSRREARRTSARSNATLDATIDVAFVVASVDARSGRIVIAIKPLTVPPRDRHAVRTIAFKTVGALLRQSSISHHGRYSDTEQGQYSDAHDATPSA